MFMTFIKSNVEMVISAGVVILALLALWPISASDATMKDTMTQRYRMASTATQLIQPISIPGAEPIPHGTYEHNVIDAMQRSNNIKLKEDATLKKLAADSNKQGRIAEPRMGGGRGQRGDRGEREVPLLAKKIPEDYLLPTIDPSRGNPYQFKHDDFEQFGIWLRELHGGTPPTKLELQNAMNRMQNAQNLNAPAAGSPFATAGGNAQMAPAQMIAFMRREVNARASEIYCYVDDGALQKRNFLRGQNPPDRTEIFEALVDSWFQQDVVDAIKKLNDPAMDDPNLKPDERNVGRAPVKRLEKIVVGANAMGNNTGPGDLFLGPTTAASAAAARPQDSGMGGMGGIGGMTPAAPSSAGLDYTKSLTGHVSTANYDVVPMKIVVDIDPAYINRFIDELYKTNNGYTVLNENLTTVDPLIASSQGYLYGPVQCVRLEIVVEGLMFRSWTQPLMPPEIRKQLGIAPEPARGGAADRGF